MHKTVPDLVKSAATRYKDRTALQIKRGFRTERFSFKKIYRNSTQLSTYLTKLGLKKGDKVIIFAPNMPEWVIAYLGAANLGVVVVPVDIQTQLETVSKFIKQCEPKLIFRSKDIRKDIESLKVTTLFLEELQETIESLPLYRDKGVVKADDLLCISYTSGTTGEPKGVMLTHRNLLLNLDMVLKVLPLDLSYKTLAILPLSHAYGQMADLLGSFRVGAEIVFTNRLNAATIGRALQRNKITALTVVPQILRLLLDDIQYHVSEQGKQLEFKLAMALAPLLPMRVRRYIFRGVHQGLGGAIQFMVSGSAPLDLKLAKTWEYFGIPILEGYGATECSAAVSINSFKNKRLGSVGKVLPGVKVKIDETSEILVKGANVSRGYYKNKLKTAKAFKNGWYYTDDIGFFDDDGYLYIKGREKFKIVKPDGMKVYVEDVEKKLNKHPYVWDSCVIGVKRKEGEVVHAVLITKKSIKLKNIIREVNRELADHQQIMEYSSWPEEDFPRRHTLKIDRNKVLKAIMYQELPAGQKTTERPLTVQGKLIKIIAEIGEVGLSELNDTLNLSLDLNLDSIKRVELVARIEEELGVVIEEAKITPQTTIKSLKKIVKKGTKKSDLRFNKTKPLGRVSKLIRLLGLRLVAEPLHSIFVKIKLEGGGTLKKIKAPAFIIMNHPGVWDSLCVTRILPNEMLLNFTGVADDRHWKVFTHRFIFETLGGTIPINKVGGPVRESLETIGEFLDTGWFVVVAPEGRYSRHGKMGEFKKGTGLMAIEMRVPVIPIKIKGDYHKIFPPGKSSVKYIPKGKGEVIVKVGEPVEFEKGTNYEEATKIMREAMEKL